MRATCSGRFGCGVSWTGYKIEHCTVCHETFTSTPAGDAHQVGTFEDGRRCLTVAEMHASKKLHQNSRGHWASGAEARSFA